jgi:gliding motility-associated-like protein
MKLKFVPPTKTVTILRLFLIFSIFCSTSISAQSPGGIAPGLELWLKADAGFTYTNTTNAEWLDQSPNNLTLNSNLIQNPTPGTNAPIIGTGIANYNPGIIFDGINAGLSSAVNAADFGFTEWTVFSVHLVAPGYDNTVWHYGADGDNDLALFINGGNPRRFTFQVNNSTVVDVRDPYLDDNIPHMVGFAANATSTETYVDAFEVDSSGGQSQLPGNGAIMLGLDADGAEAQDGNNHLNGIIGEVLIYSQKLSNSDRQKVQSYLALKYGLSLDQTVVFNYVDSNGTPFWTNDNDGYYHDVFGIGRDDASGLNQKVASSANTGSIITIALDNNFTDDNQAESRTTLHSNDKQFFMVANNGAALTTQTTELDPTSGLNVRLAREWKVDATNFTQNISLKFEGYDESWSLIATADGNFSTAVSIVGTLDADGEFTTAQPPTDGLVFTLAKTNKAPGGIISDLNLWLRADQGTVGASNLSQWTDQSPNSNNAVQATSANQPVFEENAINYHPMVDFDGTNDIMKFNNNLGLTGTNAYTLFGIMQMPTSPAKTAIIATDGCDNGFAWYQENDGAPGTIGVTQCGSGGTFGNAVIAGEITLRTVTRADSGAHVFYKEAGNRVQGIGYSFTSNNMVLGETNGNYSNIHLSELLVFNGELSSVQRKRVNSYLALKYGITLQIDPDLDSETAKDYVLSDDTTIVWDASENTGYENNIFGIGRDDLSGLDQRISKSENSGDILTMALDADFTVSNTDSGRTTEHTNDKQFLVISNNGGATTTQTTEILSSSYNTRVIREWKVDKTANFSQNVNLKFDGFDETWVLIKDDDGDFSIGITTLGTLNSTGEISGVTLADGDYFTLAKVAEGPGGIITNLSLWLKADSGFTPAQWNDQSEFNNNVIQASTNLQPAEKTNGINFNPTVVFDGSDLMQTAAGVMTSTELVDTNSSNANSQFIVFKSTGAPGTIYNYSNSSGGSYSTGAGTNGNLFLTNRYGNSGAVNNDIAYLRALRGNNTTATVRAEGAFAANVVGTNATLLDGFFNIGSQGTDGLYPFTGEIAEIINYREDVNLNINKIESYLALKYGISLDQTAPTDYVASDGSTIWDASNNTGYKTDIFGIGRDDNSGLNQKISKSINDGSILTLALEADFTSANNTGRTTQHTNNKQFLVIANNGGATTTQTTEILASSYNTRVIREWKVDKTANFSENVNLKFTGFDETWSLVKDDDGDFSTGITTLGTLDSSGEITEVTLADGDYFTLAKNDIIVPTITNFSPKFAGNGEVVTITGTGFTGTSAVTFDGVNAKSFTVNSDIEIVATVNTGSSGDITVTNSAGNDSASGFLYKVAQYDFEGNANDTTENNYDGTEVNVVTYETGAQGQAVCFDNGPGFVKLPDNLIRSLPQFTISLRFKTTGTGSILGYQNVQANVSNSPSNYIPILLITSDGKLKGTLWTSTSTSIQAISSSTVNDGNWHQVDFTAGTNSVSIYLDGSLEANTTGAAVAHLDMIYNQLGFAHTNQYNLSATTWEYFNGCIDDMVIFDRKLTEAEIETVTALPEPTIISFDPTEAGQEDTVTITGTNFDGATQVTFGGIDAASYTVDSSTQITAVLGNTAASGDVEVVTAGGTANLSGFTFTSKSELTLSTNTLNEIIYCANEKSAPESFQVSGTYLYEDLVITAPAGFEVSLSNGSGYANSVSLTPSSNAVASTTIYVRVASGQNGELSGNITVASGTESENIAVSAANNNALYFDGDYDYVTLSGNTIADGASNFTIETWILPDASNFDGNFHAIIGYQDPGGAGSTRNPSFYIKNGWIHIDSYRKSDKTRFAFFGDDAHPVVFQNVWTHMALVKEGEQYFFYVNGVLVANAPAPDAVQVPGFYQIGYIENYFAGKIDDVRFWDSPRTQAQIEDNMNVTLSGDEAGLVGYYTFNQGIAEGNNTSKTTLIDKSSSGIDGTLNNMALTGPSSNWVSGYFAQITGSDSVYKNETLQLSHAQSGGVWSSDDTGIATVNQSGLVTGVSAGSVNINYALCGQTTYKSVSVIDAGFSVSETTLTISENDGTANFTVVLDAAPTSNVVFAISSNDTNEATVDKSALTFTSANWNTPQTVKVTGVDDAIDHNDSATITIAVNDASSADSFDALADKTVAITLTDDDTASFTVSKNTMTINENAGTGTFTVVLDTEPTSNVVFDITSSPTGEATVSATELTFTTANWNTAQTITVTGVDDNVTTNDTAIISIAVNDSASDNSYDAVATQTIALTLTNDDATFTIYEINPVSIKENTVYTSVTPTLLGDTPFGTLTYTLEGTDANDFTINSSTGVVSMLARDYENPVDANTDNVYEVTIKVTDSNGNSDTEDWTVEITDDAEIAGDTNGDGVIGPGEIAGDINNDGVIGPGEIAGDINGDGTITAPEIAGDANGDGSIGSGEVAGDTNGDGSIGSGEVAGDTDGDGTIGSGEVAGDTDGDGSISSGEVAGDTDGDGTIGSGEVAGDKDGDGSIGSGEVAGDTNGDGSIGSGEVAGDTDGDGTIGSGEVAGDADGDGTIGSGEVAGDTDGDGTIGSGEVAGDADGDGTIGSGEVAGDTDGDGTIGSGEIAGDTDGDGTIGSGEIAGDINNDGIIGPGEIAGDTDGDGVPDVDDAFPNDPNESVDSDGDGQGDNADPDDDNDGTPDTEDAFPWDASEDTDTDGDGIGDNADNDDDNDGVPDANDDFPTNSEPSIVPAQAFTPNGDGNNDTWIVPGIENYPNNQVKVFNKWGHQVFATKSYRNNWEGVYKENRDKLPAGSYLYVIELGDGSEPIQGWIFINY